MIKVFDKEFELFIPQSRIAERVKELAQQMNVELNDTEPVFLAVLNGAFFFVADLLKHINFTCEISFVKIASYQGLESGTHQTLIGLDENLEGRNVVVVEDIIDSGQTMFRLVQELKEIAVADIKIATLILKPNAVRYPVAPDYIGFETPEDFLIGYGLDYNKKGRHYKDIYKLSTHQ
jgi:hypoxanthine phosphoribosyltransferase